MSAQPTPATFDQLFPGRFLRAGTFAGKQRTLTIDRIWREELEGEKGVEKKAIVAFRETPMQLVLCKLNGHCLRALFGSDVTQWIGKTVTLYPTDQLMPMPTAKGDDRFCVRVYGAPGLDRELQTEFCPPFRRPIKITLRPTGNRPDTTPAVAKEGADADPRD